MKKQRPEALSQYVWFMRLLGVFYALGALIFFFFPNEVFYLINVGPRVFRIVDAIPDSSEHFWLVLASSLMIVLSVLSFLAGGAPKVRGYALVHILSKLFTACAYLYLFVNEQKYFAYLIGFLIDIPLALLIIIVTLRVRPFLKTDPITEAVK
ncbi:MAG: hypothetical protein A3K03_05775 [Bdellovibrionales bacterium RIFOXYD1_FULL_44_7]|nr:MAG: hypothetical protein A3K03_05775 [Bdellovibrionales bacterium RIFOXYD1_FULL_44_7]